MSNKPDMEKIIKVLISLLEEQEKVEWQRIIRETVLEILIGAAIGLAFDAMLFIWLLVR